MTSREGEPRQTMPGSKPGSLIDEPLTLLIQSRETREDGTRLRFDVFPGRLARTQSFLALLQFVLHRVNDELVPKTSCTMIAHLKSDHVERLLERVKCGLESSCIALETLKATLKVRKGLANEDAIGKRKIVGFGEILMMYAILDCGGLGGVHFAKSKRTSASCVLRRSLDSKAPMITEISMRRASELCSVSFSAPSA